LNDSFRKYNREKAYEMSFVIGVISDTHGLLRPEAAHILKKCNAIIHAGDIGSMELLSSLKAIAPTFAVRGNVDTGPWAKKMAVSDMAKIAGGHFYIIHNLDFIDIDPLSSAIDAVISGHTHMPEFLKKKDILYMNPGSAGPRRFTRPVSMARIIINDRGIHPELINLE
jgi:putative phosphoesterase